MPAFVQSAKLREDFVNCQLDRLLVVRFLRDPVELALRQSDGRGFFDFEAAAVRALIAEAGEGRMQVRVLLRHAIDAVRDQLNELARVLDGFSAPNDTNLNHVAHERLERTGLEKAEARIGVMVMVAELELGFVEDLRLENRHTSRLSCSSAVSVLFFGEPQTSSGTRVCN